MEHWDLGGLVPFLGSATQRRKVLERVWEQHPGCGLLIFRCCARVNDTSKTQTAVSHVAYPKREGIHKEHESNPSPCTDTPPIPPCASEHPGVFLELWEPCPFPGEPVQRPTPSGGRTFFLTLPDTAPAIPWVSCFPTQPYHTANSPKTRTPRAPGIPVKP